MRSRDYYEGVIATAEGLRQEAETTIEWAKAALAVAPPDPRDEAGDLKYGPVGAILRRIEAGEITVGKACELLAELPDPRDEALAYIETELQNFNCHGCGGEENVHNCLAKIKEARG